MKININSYFIIIAIIIDIFAIRIVTNSVHRVGLSIKKDIVSTRSIINSQSGEYITYLKILISKPSIDRTYARSLSRDIYDSSVKYKISPDLILSLAIHESNLDPSAKSTAGALGLIQVMPKWVEVFGDRCNLLEPKCNLKQGLRLLSIYSDLYGDLELALVAYNRGPNLVDTALNNNQNPDNGYAKIVLATYDKLRSL